MKRIFSIALVLFQIMSLIGCSSPPAVQGSVKPTTASQAPEPAAAVTPASQATYEISYQKAITYSDSIGTTWVQTIVEINNTGSVPLYLSSGSYDLEDSNGNLVASQSLVSVFPDVLDVGEKGYMYEETTLDNVKGGTELTVLPRIEAVAATLSVIRFNVTDIKISDESYGGIKILGRVENTSKEAQDIVYVAVALLDSSGKPIGLVFTTLMDTLNAGDKIGFEIPSLALPENIKTASIAKYIVYSYPLQYQF